ncbi:unnamed protein product [Dibothriocephalus latus]|uniref:Uncharacterized protein n=1 Tax=Dibothriocephalus latus TaxID=60516 RepID=A0A3P6TE90_DIBLA|nr:unnamed protein product [Dibothriocephalus latus]
MQASTIKNKLTVNAITKDLLSDNPSQAEIDDWFSEVTDDPTPPKQLSERHRDDSSDFDEELDQTDSPVSVKHTSKLTFTDCHCRREYFVREARDATTKSPIYLSEILKDALNPKKRKSY